MLFTCQLYLPALQGHLPGDVIRRFRAFLEFCYIACRDVITEGDLVELQDALSRFHSFREVFAPIRGTNGFSLPRQHAIIHYPALIRLFGAPNGVCTSITESSKNPGVAQTEMPRSFRCSQPISAWTNSVLLAMTLLSTVCSMELC